MSGTRKLVEASWRAAVRQASDNGAVIASAASTVGQYLEISEGDVRRARAMLPRHGQGSFWRLVANLLAQIGEEERKDRGPLLRTGT
jgi:hypothetical protein